ncbi:VanZ family protein [Lyngbya sp. CCY1209]|uniref:VanZ family protein n=1 Tax=Lyngbya sp. CCY1209 TaxID=2886103 RepID=UPI002D20E5CE|nr:VanZ family protein [Lyngbya sp. CCY1209]MEB3882589.1 VanZ family protein [Lyngbya sp. CCY1209]
MRPNRSESNHLLFPPKLAIAIIFFSLILVFFGTLLPFNFSVNEPISWTFIARQFITKTTGEDVVANLFFFVPFGFGLSAYLYPRKLGLWGSLITVAIASCLLSVTVEIVQIFLPSRFPTLSDIILNTLGGTLGFLLLKIGLKYSSKIRFFEKLQLFLSRGSVVKIIIFSGGGLTLILLLASQYLTRLNNWNPDFPLTIGNEADGDRPWNGRVEQVCWLDRAVPANQIDEFFGTSCPQIDGRFAVFYPFVGTAPFADEYGHLSDLVWKGTQPQEPSTDGGVRVSSESWLQTSEPATPLNEQIRTTSAFTLRITFATNHLQQTGPARIITLSSGPLHRNFTLAQWGSDLYIRLRSHLTGENGAEPSVTLPNFFTDTRPHTLIVTYNGYVLKISGDRLPHVQTIEFTPDAALFWFIFSIFSGKMQLNPDYQSLYTLLYRGAILIPPGVMLAILSNFISARGKKYFSVIVGGIILASSFLLELWIAQIIPSQFQVINFVASLVFMTLPVVFIQIQFSGYDRRS